MIVLLLMLAGPPATTTEPVRIELGQDLLVERLASGVYRHLSHHDVPEYGRVPANGLIVVGTRSAALVDTPWTERQTATLFEWAERELGVRIAHVVATHSHADCMGGLAEAHRQGARSYAHALTAAFAARDGKPVPRVKFARRHRIALGKTDLVLRYFGPGHTRDNIVVWIPRSRVLFGGCLVKRTGGGAGYTAEADLTAWPDTIRKVRRAFSEAAIVVAGHGEPGTIEYLTYTEQFVRGLE